MAGTLISRSPPQECTLPPLLSLETFLRGIAALPNVRFVRALGVRPNLYWLGKTVVPSKCSHRAAAGSAKTA